MGFLYTVTEVSLMLRVDRATVSRWIKDNRLNDIIGIPSTGKRTSKIWRIPSNSLAAFLGIAEEKLPEVPEIPKKTSVGKRPQVKKAKAHGEMPVLQQ
jgi:hypothetical protein